MTAQGGRDVARAIDESAALLGSEALATRIPEFVESVEFVDYPFTADTFTTAERVDVLMQAVAEYEPKIAVGPDIAGDVTLEAAVDVGDRLLDMDGVETVILAPKDVHPSEVPDRFRVGLPFADGFSDSLGYTLHDYTSEHVDEVHVLGGGPVEQWDLRNYGVPVRSLDGSGVEIGASNWEIWTPDPPHWKYAGGSSDLYDRIRWSLDNLALAWAEHYGGEHPDVDDYHLGVTEDRDVAIVNPDALDDEQAVGDADATAEALSLLDAVGIPEDAARTILREFPGPYEAANYAFLRKRKRPAENDRALRGHVDEDRGGRLLNIDGIGPERFDDLAALSPHNLESFGGDCERVQVTTGGPDQGEIVVECSEEDLALRKQGPGEWMVYAEAGPDAVGLDSGSRIEMTEFLKEQASHASGDGPEQYRPTTSESDDENTETTV